MALFNHSTRELTAKIVYYGPGLCGKTTNLQVLHAKLERATTGKLLSLSTANDRTIYFDLLPIELGNIKGYTVRFQLCTVPGQVYYNETRKIVLRGVDGIVFVVDSQWSLLSHNLESFQNLVDNLDEEGLSLETIPLVIQYNKRDLSGALSVQALQDALSFHSFPFVEAVASEGKGVTETFKLISKLTFVDLLRRLQKVGGAWGDAAVIPPAEAPKARPISASTALAALHGSRPEPPPVRTPSSEEPMWTPPSAEGAFPDLSDEPAGDRSLPVRPAEEDEPSLVSVAAERIVHGLPAGAQDEATTPIELVPPPPEAALEDLFTAGLKRLEDRLEAASTAVSERLRLVEEGVAGTRRGREDAERDTGDRLVRLEDEVRRLHRALEEAKGRAESLRSALDEMSRRWQHAVRRTLDEMGE